MSLDAGGLAQMTYNNSFNNGSSLGVPSSGFASRGKGSHIKRLSVPPQVATIDESQPSVSTPRTSRSHLLAGLRTAPRSATIPSQQQRSAMEGGRFPVPNRSDRVPQTATGAGFPQHTFASNQGMNPRHRNQTQNRPMYTMPEQVLAPPLLDMGNGDVMDENLYAELMSTNLFLAAQQQRLQQQLMSVTAAAQQFQGLTLGASLPHLQLQHQQQQQVVSPSMASAGFYQQQLQQGVQPVVQPVPGQPGLFSVYNPLTGQQSYVMDHNSPAQEDKPFYSERHMATHQVPQFRAEISPPADSAPLSMHFPQRSVSPPSGTPSPPAEATGAFRRNHRKNGSFNPTLKTGIDTIKANVGAGPRSAVFPPTPATGTFGPGQARAGEHPARQPRNPPSLEDLLAKPTSKHEGSKNFATRQRRRAVHNLVRAGIERRADSRSNGYNSSGGTNTPASEKEFTFSDGDDVTVRSGSLSSKPSLGSLRAAASGAIGSERKEKSSRRSPDSPYQSASPTSEDGYFSARLNEIRSEQASQVSSPSGASSPSVAAVVAGQGQVAQAPERRKTPMLVLSSAEKRKTPLM
ncbi:hypothetical protein N7468_009378 [Penicillium chermesinum]|uniref:Uncharacterized protein n=1 Tax=Penicillium chermesinum TaxID=63820 RepID=A0A9W9TF72_9EURO|nr:uncharacterized protein N7468_009378 [Penicillium chermesinum]KAJ5220174.1 hypothetical protein N7468_009378 [Penicillium chermesinum]